MRPSSSARNRTRGGREKLTRSTFDFLRFTQVKSLPSLNSEPEIFDNAECSTVTYAGTRCALVLVFSQQYCGTATNPKYTISCGWRYVQKGEGIRKKGKRMTHV